MAEEKWNRGDKRSSARDMTMHIYFGGLKADSQLPILLSVCALGFSVQCKGSAV